MQGAERASSCAIALDCSNFDQNADRSVDQFLQLGVKILQIACSYSSLCSCWQPLYKFLDTLQHLIVPHLYVIDVMNFESQSLCRNADYVKTVLIQHRCLVVPCQGTKAT